VSLIDDFLNNSHAEVDATMGVKTMVCDDGQTFSVVWDDFRSDTDGGLGGLEPQVQAIATAQPLDVTNPLLLKNKRCTVGGVAFRIYAVQPGTVAIRFDLCDPNENR
jgi:hypothetical protein